MADSNSKDKKKSKKQSSWPLRVFLLAVALSAVMSFFSSTALEGAGYMVTLLVLAMFIALGIIFDMVGVAVTAAGVSVGWAMATGAAPAARRR